MERTKKLFAYIVAFVAIVSMFIAGISVQSNPSYANPSTQQSGKFTKATTVDEKGITISIDLIFNVPATPQETKEELNAADKNIENVVKNDNKVRSELNKIAQEQGGNQATADAMVYSDAFKIVLENLDNTDVRFDLTYVPLAIVEFALFKADGQDDWIVLLPVEEKGANNAASKAGTRDIVFNIPTTGIIIFGQYSPDKTVASKCCDDCSEDCPFCPYLCKGGVCYCWTIYLVIVLSVILLILLIVLIVVKAKGKKAVDVQELPAAEDPNIIPPETTTQEESQEEEQEA